MINPMKLYVGYFSTGIMIFRVRFRLNRDGAIEDVALGLLDVVRERICSSVS